jgi:hypothetical protein
MMDPAPSLQATEARLPTTGSRPATLTDTLLLEDRIFRSMIALNVAINYYQRTKVPGSRYAEGVERDKTSDRPLFTAALYVDCPEIEQRAVHDTVHLRGPLRGPDLERLLLAEEGDGAYVAYTAPEGILLSEERHIIMLDPTPIVAQAREARPDLDVRNYGDVLASGIYLPHDFVGFADTAIDLKRLGGRTRHAVTTPVLLGGGKVYMIKQTVYDGGNVGKTVMFDKDGLAAEFFLAKADGLSPGLRAAVRDSSFFDRQEGVVGVLRSYGPGDKRERSEYLVPPAGLSMSIAKLRSYAKAPQPPVENPLS